MRVPTPILAASEHAIGVFLRISTFFLVSWLGGPYIQGQFALFIAAQTLAMTLGGLALDVANAVLVGRDSVERRGNILANSLFTLTLTGLVAAIGALVAGASGVLAEFDAPVLAMLSVAAFASTLGLGLGGILIGAYAFQWRAVSAAAGAVACVMGLALTSGDGALSVTEVAGSWIASVLIANVVLTLGAFHVSAGRRALDGALFREQITLAMQAYPYFISTNLLMRVGTFAVAYFLGTERLGVFAIALAATEALLNLPRLFVPMVMGNAANRCGDVARILGSVHSFLLASTLIAAPALYFVLERLLPVSFSGVGIISLVLLAGTVPFGLGTLAANHLLGRGLGSRASRCAIAGALAAAILLPLGTAAFGLIGAAAATMIVQIFFAALTLGELGRVESLGIAFLVRPRLPWGPSRKV